MDVVERETGKGRGGCELRGDVLYRTWLWSVFLRGVVNEM